MALKWEDVELQAVTVWQTKLFGWACAHCFNCKYVWVCVWRGCWVGRIKGAFSIVSYVRRHWRLLLVNKTSLRGDKRQHIFLQALRLNQQCFWASASEIVASLTNKWYWIHKSNHRPFLRICRFVRIFLGVKYLCDVPLWKVNLQKLVQSLLFAILFVMNRSWYISLAGLCRSLSL